ncbi:hypothetical protein UT300012_22780 [Paraclostridium bifermentans]
MDKNNKMSVNKGKVYLASIREYKECNCRANFLITVSRKGVHGTLVPFDKLAPSSILFEEILIAKENKDEEHLRKCLDKFRGYRPRPGVQAGIHLIKQLLDLGQNVALVCYCSDVELCHRKIVGDWFSDLEYEVVYG